MIAWEVQRWHAQLTVSHEISYEAITILPSSSNITPVFDTTPTKSGKPLPLPGLLFFYLAVSIVGMIGNVFVLVAVLGSKRMRTVHNIFTLNLCVAFILHGFNAAMSVVDAFEDNWAVDNGICNILSFLAFIPPIAIVASMVIIARHRYQAITNMALSRHYLYSSKASAVSSLVIWLVTLVFAMPILFGWVTSRNGYFCACCIYFFDNNVYGVLMTVFIYVIPNVLIGFFYGRIFGHVRRSRVRVRDHQRHGSDCRSTPGTYPHRRSEIRLAVQFIILVLVFNLSYFPSLVVFWIESSTKPVSPYVQGTVTIVFASNIVMYPIVFFSANRIARGEIGRVLFRQKNIADTRSQEVRSRHDDNHLRPGRRVEEPISVIDAPMSAVRTGAETNKQTNMAREP